MDEFKQDQVQSCYFTTNDDVQLHYVKGGFGQPTVFLPGGGFSLDIFREQLPIFCQKLNGFALDQRGHGLSDKPSYGYRVARLAKDLYEFMQEVCINDVNLIGHSLGASVIYAYIDLFGSNNINKLVLIDEPSILLRDPNHAPSMRAELGAIYDPCTVHEILNQFKGKEVESFKRKLIDQMTTRFADEEIKQFLFSSMTLPNEAAMPLYLNNICQDYRDILPRIDVPTLLITGKASLHPWQSHQWMAKQISDAHLEVFGEGEGGGHFMFLENPEKFNQLVLSFLL